MKVYTNPLKKIIFYSFVVITVITSCSTQKSILESAKTFENFRGFEPTDPTEYDDKVPIVVDDKIVLKEIKLLNSGQMFSFLNNEII